MTLTLTAYDASPEVHDFFAKVKAAQGHVTGVRYPRGHNATIELTAHVPEQPELLPCPTAHNLTSTNLTNGND